MACEWKRKLKERHRGDWCLGTCVDENGKVHGYLCGCGTRCEPNIEYRRRIVRRRLDDELRDMINRNVTE